MRLKISWFLFILVQTVLVQAEEIYKLENKQGDITYTDRYTEGAQSIELPEIITVPSIKVEAPQHQATPQKNNQMYNISIQSPNNESTFHNISELKVEVNISPSLSNKDQIQIWIDDQPLGTPQSSTKFIITPIYRGAHSIQAVVLKPSGEKISQSTPIRVYIHKTNVHQ